MQRDTMRGDGPRRPDVASAMRRKGEDTSLMKRRRMPYVAKIKRDDPFRPADSREIEAMVRRIAAVVSPIGRCKCRSKVPCCSSARADSFISGAASAAAVSPCPTSVAPPLARW